MVCAVCVVDGDARLHIVAEHVEADAVTVILDRVRLHLNALSDEIVAVENRGDTVHDMAAGFLDVVRDHVLEGKHAVNIHVARAGDEIAAVRIFGGQLPADEMAAVIQVLSVDEIILCRDPSGRLDLADRAALFAVRRHQIGRDAGIGNAAAAEAVERRIAFERACCKLGCGEGRLIVVDHDIGLAAERRDVIERCGCFRGGRCAAGRGAGRARCRLSTAAEQQTER